MLYVHSILLLTNGQALVYQYKKHSQSTDISAQYIATLLIKKKCSHGLYKNINPTHI